MTKPVHRGRAVRNCLPVICFFITVLPAYCLDFDLKKLDDTLTRYGLKEAAESAAGISLDTVTEYLDWDRVNLSMQADMKNTSVVLGRRAEIDAEVFKLGMRAVRIDPRTVISIPRADRPVTLTGMYMLRYPLKDTAFMVLPKKKTYMKLDPERSRELLGELRESLHDRKAEIMKKEMPGSEEMDGRMCDRAHVIMKLYNGTRVDATAWLAQGLKGFPVKISADFTTPRGIKGTNTTLFTNIRKTVPDEKLFDIPDNYRRCKNIVEMLGGGAFGSRPGRTGRKRLQGDRR